MICFQPNIKQRRILWGAVLVGILMLLFPPFHFVTSERVETNLGYSFLLSPPEVTSFLVGSVNLSMLLAQWLILAVVSTILYLLMSGQSSTKSPKQPQPTTAVPPPCPIPPAVVEQMTGWTPLKWLIRIVTVAAGLAAIGIIRGIAHDVGGPEAFIARIILVGTIAGGLVWVWARTSHMR